MGKYSGYLFCSDCDGTLTDSNRQVSQENRDAIRYFQSEGGLFTLATGRYPSYIAGLSKDVVPNAPIVASNGALLYDLEKGRVVRGMELGEGYEAVVTYAFDRLPTIREFCFSGVDGSAGDYLRREHWYPGAGSDLFQEYAPADSAREILESIGQKNVRPRRIFFIQQPEHTEENYTRLKEKFGAHFTFMMGWECGLECLPKNCGKGEMIAELRKILGDEVHTVVCAGDYDNDRSMFREADIGYAVANAPDYVKACANRVTVSCDKSAIARIIEELC